MTPGAAALRRSQLWGAKFGLADLVPGAWGALRRAGLGEEVEGPGAGASGAAYLLCAAAALARPPAGQSARPERRAASPSARSAACRWTQRCCPSSAYRCPPLRPARRPLASLPALQMARARRCPARETARARERAPSAARRGAAFR